VLTISNKLICFTKQIDLLIIQHVLLACKTLQLVLVLACSKWAQRGQLIHAWHKMISSVDPEKKECTTVSCVLTSLKSSDEENDALVLCHIVITSLRRATSVLNLATRTMHNDAITMSRSRGKQAFLVKLCWVSSCKNIIMKKPFHLAHALFHENLPSHNVSPSAMSTKLVNLPFHHLFEILFFFWGITASKSIDKTCRGCDWGKTHQWCCDWQEPDSWQHPLLLFDTNWSWLCCPPSDQMTSLHLQLKILLSY